MPSHVSLPIQGCFLSKTAINLETNHWYCMGNVFRITAWNLDLTIDQCFGGYGSDNWMGIPKRRSLNEDVWIIKRFIWPPLGNTIGPSRSDCNWYYCFGIIWNRKISKTRCYYKRTSDECMTVYHLLYELLECWKNDVVHGPMQVMHYEQNQMLNKILDFSLSL